MATTTCSDASQAKAEPVQEATPQKSRSQNRFNALWENVRDGLAILDPDLTIIMANRALQDLFPDRPLVGKKCFNAFRCQAGPCLTAAALRGDCPGEDVHESSTLMRPCRSPHELESALSPVFSSSGRLEEILLIVRKGNGLPPDAFWARIAHEINNPLASITGFSEGLLKRLGSAPEGLNGKMLAFFKEYLEIINSEAYRCKGILQRITRERGRHRG
jgi:two-component system, NtrC family, sensor kinase